MMTKKKKTNLIPDGELRNRMVEQLYSKRPLLEEGSVFSELLQGMVNQMLDGEMDYFLEEESNSEIKNKRNVKTKKHKF